VRRFLYDTSIFVYALGGEHRYREPCREIVRLAATGGLQGEASGDLLQELMHQRARRTGNRTEAARAARHVAKLAWWHPVEPNDVQRGIDLFEPTMASTLATPSSPSSQSTAASRRSSPRTAPSTESTASSESTPATNEPSPAWIV
jgi:predicted nucleic acid-binding protein